MRTGGGSQRIGNNIFGGIPLHLVFLVSSLLLFPSVFVVKALVQEPCFYLLHENGILVYNLTGAEVPEHAQALSSSEALAGDAVKENLFVQTASEVAR